MKEFLFRQRAFLLSFLSHVLLTGVLLFFSQSAVNISNTENLDVLILDNPKGSLNSNQQLTKEKAVQRSPIKTVSDNVAAAAKTVTNNSNNASTEENSTEGGSTGDLAEDYMITSKARLLSKIVANRTDEARRLNCTGSAQILLIVDKFGSVTNSSNINQLDCGLSERALEIAKQLKFIPAQINNESVASKVRLRIDFKSSN